ncbi:MAG: tetratricopeptide repeat protein [Rhodocyclaceae bacterium]|nr:MAG: tetratricopeptide repeat protein [Rhodocyclaceae bacterium]
MKLGRPQLISTRTLIGPLVLIVGILHGGLAIAADPASLFKAADTGDVKAVQAAISQGIPVDSADQDGWTPLMVAAASGKLPVVQALVKAGANVNARTTKGDTPLMAAVLSGNVAIIKLLLSEGADKTIANAQGMTAADVARKAKNDALVKLLAGAPASEAKTGTVNPKVIEAKVDAAADAFKTGNYDRAAELFKDVVRLDSKHAMAWHFLGQSLAKTGNFNDSRNAYLTSIDIQPSGQLVDRNQEMLTKLPYEYKVHHILVKTKGEAQEIIEQLKLGESYGNLAKEKSLDSGSKDKSGDLGWVSLGVLVKPFGDAVASLRKAAFTIEPIQTQFGWHVILLEDYRIKPLSN